MELWRIVLLGTLPIVLALPLPGAAALAITSLSVPPPPVAPERQGMLQAKHPCSPPCQVALVPQRSAHPTALMLLGRSAQSTQAGCSCASHTDDAKSQQHWAQTSRERHMAVE